MLRSLARCGVALAALIAAAPPAAAGPARDLAKREGCLRCHGWDGIAAARTVCAPPLSEADCRAGLWYDLARAGARLKGTWLAGYLRTHGTLRPYLAAERRAGRRSAAQAARLAAALTSGAAPEPAAPPPGDAALGRQVMARLRCDRCHVEKAPPGVSLRALAPPLPALARVRADWARAFLRNPARASGVPGIGMPRLWPKGAPEAKTEIAAVLAVILR